MIYEIRNYHYEPTQMQNYQNWAKESALPYIRKHLDLVGFWVNTNDKPEVSGKPQDDLGTATVTWIIRWPDVQTRHREFPNVFGSDEWKEIMQKNPGQANYHRSESKFAVSL